VPTTYLQYYYKEFAYLVCKIIFTKKVEQKLKTYSIYNGFSSARLKICGNKIRYLPFSSKKVSLVNHLVNPVGHVPREITCEIQNISNEFSLMKSLASDLSI